MAGIKRFIITDELKGRGAYRFEKSRKLQLVANNLYREIFKRMKADLAEGYEEVRCTKAQFQAGYDYALGIDVILQTHTNQSFTMQEKFLFTTFDTITVEYMQDWKREVPGDWFNMKCQLYFTGYDYRGIGVFDTWCLADWPRIQLATTQKRIPWAIRPNKFDGCRSNFQYVNISALPQDVVIDRKISQNKPPRK